MADRDKLEKWRNALANREKLARQQMEKARAENKLKEFEESRDEHEMLSHTIHLIDCELAKLPKPVSTRFRR